MKLNFITDQGSILASTSCARRVGAVPRGTLPVRVAAATRSRTAAAPAGMAAAAGARDGRAGFFGLGFVSDANEAVTLDATLGGGAGRTCAGYGGAWDGGTCG
jgi:hypothetical protein